MGIGVTAYHQGRADGAADARLEELGHQRDSVITQIDTAHHATIVAAREAERSIARADRMAKARDSVRAPITTPSDSTVSIDNGPPIAVPAPVVQLIRLDDQFAANLQRALVAEVARSDALSRELALERQARLIVGQENAILRKQAHPRFGFKTGLGLGLLLAIAALH